MCPQSKIVSVNTFGILVQLAEHQLGFVPDLFMSDVRLRNPAKRFKENAMLPTMVRGVFPCLLKSVRATPHFLTAVDRRAGRVLFPGPECRPCAPAGPPDLEKVAHPVHPAKTSAIRFVRLRVMRKGEMRKGVMKRAMKGP